MAQLLQNLSPLAGFDQHFANTSSPLRLILQIVTLQGFYYAVALLLFLITSFLLGQEFDPGWLFSWKAISLDNSFGLTLIVLWLFDALISVVFIMLVIGRSKLAWDFAITVHVLNLINCWLAEGFPESFGWWTLQVLSCAIMVALGTYTTRWKELRDTFFDGLVDAELGQSTAMMHDVETQPTDLSIDDDDDHHHHDQDEHDLGDLRRSRELRTLRSPPQQQQGHPVKENVPMKTLDRIAS